MSRSLISSLGRILNGISSQPQALYWMNPSELQGYRFHELQELPCVQPGGHWWDITEIVWMNPFAARLQVPRALRVPWVSQVTVRVQLRLRDWIHLLQGYKVPGIPRAPPVSARSLIGYNWECFLVICIVQKYHFVPCAVCPILIYSHDRNFINIILEQSQW